MIASVTRMQQQQASSGLGMRPDVLNARQRMEFYLNEAEGALRAGDAVKAKRSLGQAEKEVEKLENFFGR